MQKIITWYKSDSPYSIQGQQLFNLLLLLILGKTVLDLQITWGFIGGVIISGIVIDHFFIFLRERKISFFSLSSILTSLGLSFMLFLEYFWMYPVLLFVALGQKYIFRFSGSHIFNPSNLAVTLGLLLFPTVALPIVGQWGEYPFLAVILIFLGSLITWRVQRFFIPILFFTVYILLQYIIIIPLNESLLLEDVVYRMSSGAFIIFVFFMLTDPRTTPATKPYQVLFVLMTASVSVVFDYFFSFSVVHLFFALTMTTTLVPIFRILAREREYSIIEETKAWAFSLFLFILVTVASIQYLQSSTEYLFIT